ncbi:zinc finger protein 624-like [Neocloeon triangulifer]|uniref:zinc finger protein 624-like n=1 Tax=Neocloeon triangulifer TaxID=2078957 RepID=UPI00286EF5CB|nr:zinc finger protein 624-like [Neocloeon triangulifer]XP_059483308.1 zinc finger protein 624-like [Neocloeon triangulifer]
MDNKCQLCCKRNGEIFRTDYFQLLITKHITPNFEGDVCICESCGQVLRHWDEFSKEASENLSRKNVEPDSCQNESSVHRSCDQQTQTEELEDDTQNTQHDHSYAKSPTLPSKQKQMEDEFCQVDSSSLGYEDCLNTAGYPIRDFAKDSFYESAESDIKILEVCALKDEQWFDEYPRQDFKEEPEAEWNPARIKEEPPVYDDSTEESTWHDNFFYQPPIEPQRLAFVKMKDETGMLFPILPILAEQKMENLIKDEFKVESKPTELMPPPTLPNNPTPSASSYSCPICSKEFPSNDLLVQHLRSHQNFFKPALNLACPDCNQEFQSEHILIEHIMEYHFYTNERGEVPCVICSQLLQGSDLRMHIFNCHFNTNPHATHVTGVVANEAAKKRTAAESKKPEVTKQSTKVTTTFSCKLCKVKLSSRFKLKLHVEQKHKGKKIVVKKAGDVVRSQKSQKLHSERNKRFYCKLCMKSFPSAKGMACHITMIHKKQYNVPNKHFQCPKCKRFFVYKARLESHICEQTSTSEPHERSPSVFTFVQHYRKLQDGKYVCKHCPDRYFYSYSGIVKHLRKEHNSKCRNLATKEEKAKEPSSMKKEEPEKILNEAVKPNLPRMPPRDKIYVRMKRRQQMVACETCSRRFMTKRQLRIHRKKLCKPFRATQNLSMQQYYLLRRTHFLCNLCYKSDNEFEFQSIEDVKHHLEMDHNLTLLSSVEIQFVCKFCSLLYKCRAYLKTHIKQKHKDELLEAKPETPKLEVVETPKLDVAGTPPKEEKKLVVNKYKCEICGKLLPLQIALQKHVLLKHPKPDIKTEPSEEKSVEKEIVPESRSNENENECSICGKKFKLSIALQKHMSSHSAPNPAENQPAESSAPPATFSCQLCGKSFPNSDQLQDHKTSHEAAKEEKPKESNQSSQPAKKSLLTCDLCDKGLKFFSQIALDQHKRKYHKPS